MKILRYIIFFLVFVTLVHPGQSSAQDRLKKDFFLTIKDVPLMPGLEEVTEEAIVFDKPDGRIIESLAVSSHLIEKEIEVFYSRTLPQLGWVQTGKTTYIRKNEQLSLQIEDEGEYKFVRIMVEPYVNNKN